MNEQTSLPSAPPRLFPTAMLDYRDQVVQFEMPTEPTPPRAAPNVLLILVDDMGFGASSAFGGPCRMPTADRLASEGLRFSRFHTTAMCSPTRAALLTGRNHHSVGMGCIGEMATPAPGYNGMRGDDAATLAQLLKLNGYATGAFGKMHQTPPAEATPAGPYARWPTGEGFEEFYGFLGAETDQYRPNLIHGTRYIDQPDQSDYHLSVDLADKLYDWVDTVSALKPDKPWFGYLSFGACHAPFQVPEDWRQAYRTEFDHGWDEQRERTLQRQIKFGVVPPTATLSQWPDDVPRWGDLDEKAKAVACRLMENYAAFAEHMDQQVGRLVDRLESAGQLENTLVLYILGDNGASAEGLLEGTLNEIGNVNGVHLTTEQMYERLDEIGGETIHGIYPVGWAIAMDTPYQWTKQIASHFGGTRNGMIAWGPDVFTARGEIRHQFGHVIDVAPTILELAGLRQPDSVLGVPQRPIEGTSFAYCLDDADATEQHTTQYFELMGSRAIYHEGWTAVARHRKPWSDTPESKRPFAGDTWELYDTTADWSQAHDLASNKPAKLRQLQDLFIAEATKYRVFPMDDRYWERMNAAIAGRPDLMAGRTSISFGTSTPPLREDAAPNMKNRSFRIDASVDLAEEARGVIVSQGGRFAGWSFYLVNGILTYHHNYCAMERYTVSANEPTSRGLHELSCVFDYDGGGLGRGGLLHLLIDGVEIGSGRVHSTTPYLYSLSDTMDIGVERGTPVTLDYPTGHTSRLHGLMRVRFSLGPIPDATQTVLDKVSLVTALSRH